MQFREEVVRVAKDWARLGRASKDNGPIDRYVIQPFRPILIEMKHLGPKDDVTFLNWCGMWVHAVLTASGMPIPQRIGKATLTLAAVQGWLHMAQTFECLNAGDPKPGDILLFQFDKDKQPDHIGVLLDWQDKTQFCSTAEGNVHNREAFKQRHKVTVMAVIDVEKLATKFTGKQQELAHP